MILKPTIFTPVNKSHPLARGLVGCWPMNEGAYNKDFTKVFDLSGNGNHGIFSELVTWSAGIHGSSINLPATAEEVDIGTPADHPSLDVDVITIAAIIKPGDLSSWGTIYGAQYDQGAWLALDSSEKVAFYTKGVDVAYDTWTGIGSSLTIGQWYHVAATYDGKRKYVYVNGILIGSKDTGAKAGLLDIDTAEVLAIGMNITGTYDFVGDISSVTVWNRVLSASEIALLYREPFCMFEREPIELLVAATSVGAPPAGNPGIMTTNTGFWGPTF